MSWEAVNALATLASALIVAVAAFAAVVQIRHLRAGNQLDAILRIYDTFNSTEMVDARRYCISELPAALNRVAGEQLTPTSMDPRVLLVGNFFNEIGALVVDNVLDERLIWPFIPVIAGIWAIVAPVAHAWRRGRADPVWADFEYVAALEARVIRATHLGRYPAWFRERLRSEQRDVG